MPALRTASILVLFLCTTLGLLRAQTPSPAHRPEQAVEDLGDQSYPVRAAAEQHLRRLGRAAVPALERGLKHKDPEVQQRCATLLPLVRRSDLDIQLDTFLHNQRDAKLPPLPGWARFKTMVGNDLSARLLYLKLYRRNKAVLELLEKDPDKLAAQFAPRLLQFVKITRLPLSGQDLESRINQFQVLMLTELCQQAASTLPDQVVSNLFDCPLARAATENDPALRRLVARVFTRQITSLVKAREYAPHAKSLQLLELLQSHVRSLVEKQVDEAVRSNQIDQLMSAVTIAIDFQCFEMLEATLKAAVLRVVDQIQTSDDFSELQVAISLCEILEMPKTLKERLKPAVIRFFFNSAGKIKSWQRLHEASCLAGRVELKQMFHNVLRPALIKLVAEAADNFKDKDLVKSAMKAATVLEMPEVLESLLLPAARRGILEVLEKRTHWSELFLAVTLSQHYNLKDVLNENVKPLLCKYFQDLAVDSGNEHEISTMLLPARELQMKEVVPFALRVALDKNADANLRGQVILFVGELGNREQGNQLQPLLKDTSSLEWRRFDPQKFDVQIRDVALAVLLVQQGELLADYGFADFQRQQPHRPLYNTTADFAGFADNAAREAAFKKYHALVTTRKK